MTEFETTLMRRDNLNEQEARQQRKEARKAIENILANGGDYDDIEEMLLGSYGLEMDFIFDLI